MKPTAYALAGLMLFASGAAEAQRRARIPDIVVTGARPMVAPIGGDLFPVDPPPAASCLANAPPLAPAPAPAGIVDGTKIKNVRALDGLRRKHKGVLMVRGVDLTGQKFGKAKLQDVCFIQSKLGLTDWNGFTGSGVGFVSTDLTGAKFTGARLPYALFRNAVMTNVDASGADFTRARLDGGWDGSMRGLKLDRATLVGFRIECGVTAADGCPLDRDGISLKGANLAKASVWPFPFADADATDAILDQTEVGVDHLARLRGAKLVGSLVVRSRRAAAIYLPAELARIQQAFATGDEAANCGAVVTPVQRAICASPRSELQRLDRLVAEQEARRSVRPGARTARTSWLGERDACGTRAEDEIAACLTPVYRARLESLARTGGAPSWLRPGGMALFLSADTDLSPEFVRSELFLRTSPVMLESSQARVLLRVGPGGRIEAKGAALGGCRLGASGLSYNPATLALSTGGAPAGRRRRAVAGTPVLKLTGDELQVVAAGEPHVTCGPSGTFVPMMRAEVPEGTLAAMWTEL